MPKENFGVSSRPRIGGSISRVDTTYALVLPASCVTSPYRIEIPPIARKSAKCSSCYRWPKREHLVPSPPEGVANIKCRMPLRLTNPPCARKARSCYSLCPQTPLDLSLSSQSSIYSHLAHSAHTLHPILPTKGTHSPAFLSLIYYGG